MRMILPRGETPRDDGGKKAVGGELAPFTSITSAPAFDDASSFLSGLWGDLDFPKWWSNPLGNIHSADGG